MAVEEEWQKGEHSVCCAFKDTLVSPGMCVCVCLGGGCHVIVVSHSQEGFLSPFPLVCGPMSNIKSQSTHIHKAEGNCSVHIVPVLSGLFCCCFIYASSSILPSLIQDSFLSHICMPSPFFSDFQISQHLSEAKKSQQSLESTYKQLDSVSHP